MRDYEELVRQLRKEADAGCTNCCYRAEGFTCVAPDDRKKDCDDYTKLQAADAIEELVSNADKFRWISVEERLPEHLKDVLVSLSVGEPSTVTCGIDGYSERLHKWVGFEMWYGIESPVTHWMPLPEPPKEDGNA